MNRFSLLLEQIIYSPSRNRKIELMSNYFRNTIDPDRGYSLAILTGNLKFNKLRVFTSNLGVFTSIYSA